MTFLDKLQMRSLFGNIILIIFTVLLVADIFYPATWTKLSLMKSTPLAKGDLIISPIENEIFQESGGQSQVQIITSSTAKCLVDGIKVDLDHKVTKGIGKHSLQCRSAGKEEVVPFYIGDVFILMGQSNAIGASKNTSLAPPSSPETVWYDPYKRVFRTPGTDDENVKKGIEIGGNAWTSFMNEYRLRSSKPVGIINLTRVSTIDRYFQGELFPTAGDWYYDFVVDEIQKYYQPRGIIWYHGESATIAKTDAEIYSYKLLLFIQSIRRNLRFEIPFFIINIGKNNDKSATLEVQTNWNTVKTGIRDISASMSGVYLVDDAARYTLNCEEISGDEDCIHLGQDGQNKLGVSVASKILNIVNKNIK